VSLGGEIEWFSASLQVSGEDLDPADITQLLGPPTQSQKKGMPRKQGGNSGDIARFGRWERVIKPTHTDEWDVAEVIRMLFADLPSAQSVWGEVAKRGNVRVALGLNVSLQSGQDFVLDAELVRLLADRSASVWIDVFRDSDHET
jgi:hypothetical protein